MDDTYAIYDENILQSKQSVNKKWMKNQQQMKWVEMGCYYIIFLLLSFFAHVFRNIFIFFYIFCWQENYLLVNKSMSVYWKWMDWTCYTYLLYLMFKLMKLLLFLKIKKIVLLKELKESNDHNNRLNTDSADQSLSLMSNINLFLK